VPSSSPIGGSAEPQSPAWRRLLKCVALTAMLACGSPAEPSYFVRIGTDRITIFEGRSTDVSASASLPRGNLEAGLLSWHLSGLARPAEPSVVIEYLNDIHTVVRVWGFAGDSGYIVASQAGSSPKDSAVIVVRPVSIATMRLDPDPLRIAVGEQGVLFPIIQDSSGAPLVRASLAWSVSDTTVAVVQGQRGGGVSGSGQGLVMGKRAGATTVFATVEGVTASAEAVVTTP
jgi:hypothetical protein